MTSINYNEFQPGQGVSAPDLNENFTLTNNAIEDMAQTLNSAITSLTSTTNLKANKNGSSAEVFSVATATEDNNAVNLAQLNSRLLPVSPVGSFMWFAGTSVPDGYLLCNGSAVSRTTYADLFAVIGVKYGAGDSATTFNLPNLINKFLEGGASAGTYREAGLPNITGSYFTSAITNGTPQVSGAFNYFGNGSRSGGEDGRGYGISFNASASSAIYGKSNTVQPEALTMLPCIRY